MTAVVDEPEAAVLEADGRVLVEGKPYLAWPKDLYIPPDALEVILERFQGPLDLLLYLIRRNNIDILDIPVAEITRQYMEYVELMQLMRLDLAAEYLVMAATLAEIKSRMLLPRPGGDDEDGEDPRAALVRRLQEYERYRDAAERLDRRPRLERDLFVVHAHLYDPDPPVPQPRVTLTELVDACRDALQAAARRQTFVVGRERLSLRERMTEILDRLRTEGYARFDDLFRSEEGRSGLVVTFIAILELARDNMLVVIQNEPFAPIHVRAPGR